MTTLGWLKHRYDPQDPYLEWQYLQIIHYFLTKRWWILQGGVNEEALNEWVLAMQVLELDKKAQRGLFLLAQSGHVGRTRDKISSCGTPSMAMPLILLILACQTW